MRRYLKVVNHLEDAVLALDELERSYKIMGFTIPKNNEFLRRVLDNAYKEFTLAGECR